jgi:hypothetical protein
MIILKLMLKQYEDMESSGSFSPASHPQIPMFYPRSIRVGLLVERGALGEVVLRVLWFTPVSIIAPYSFIYLTYEVV